MAAYYTSCQGSRGSVSRLGGSQGGVNATVAGWSGGCDVYLSDNDDGVPWLRVVLRRWHGNGIERTIYDGPVNALGKPATFIKPKKAKG